MYKVLMVDDDQELCQLIQTFFTKHFLEINAVHTGADALEQVTQDQYDALILDQNLPDVHGLELCEQLRKHYQGPVLILSGEGGEVARVLGLRAGADDYLEKPFSRHELLERMKKLIERCSQTASSLSVAPEQGTYRFADFEGYTLDFYERLLRPRENRDKKIQLTDVEFKILSSLVMRNNALVRREDIEQLAAEPEQNSRSFDVHISRIRKKLGNSTMIKTIHGHGYMMVGSCQFS
ncbi:response regulator transcription factor [Piscirickettsia litoralis]|uniref:Transcriptional regulator n=1 Tax=Piscirickettsia litoralis TaxID=1891921 RepID=A0ABX3A2A1_9GAMM|nr:response regulator transcription factor [Piscirickettsia litoralis]ODN42958.1 transcriptional regulator [Piscirickettsia litoralis]